MLLRFRPTPKHLIFLSVFMILLLCAAFRRYNGGLIGIPTYKPMPTSPRPPPRRNTIVMATTKSDDASWVSKDLPDWEPAIYSVDNTSAPLHTPANKGKESMAYLTYIIDNYDILPNISIFLHSHRDGYPVAWHNDNQDYSNVWSVKHLKLSAVKKRGFVNLRCNWVPGCPADIQVHRNPPEAHRDLEHVFEQAWKELFGKGSKVPERIGTPCCAQFAATREAIRKRTREEWIGYRGWLLRTEWDDEMSGRVFEFIWHILMGREPVMCSEYMPCYCEVYGMYCPE